MIRSDRSTSSRMMLICWVMVFPSLTVRWRLNAALLMTPSGFFNWCAISAARRPAASSCCCRMEKSRASSSRCRCRSTRIWMPAQQAVIRTSSRMRMIRDSVTGASDSSKIPPDTVPRPVPRMISFMLVVAARSRTPEIRYSAVTIRLTETWTSACGMMAAFRTISARGRSSRGCCQTPPSPWSGDPAWPHPARP